MNAEQVAVIVTLVFCCIIPIGLIVLLLDAIFSGYQDSILRVFISELEK